MLRIYSVMIDVLTLLRPVLAQVRMRDTNLEDQMRRAATSVVLNVADGSGSRGRNRTARYGTALGSARETAACLEIAVSLGYVTAVDERIHAGLRQVMGTLVKVGR